MKLSILFLATLFSILLSCNPKQPAEQQSSDSTSVTKESPPDSVSMAQEAAQSNDEPDDEVGDGHDPQDDVDHNQDHISVNTSEYKFLGFSEDLEYAAFAIAWGADGGMDIRAKLYVVNVDKNDFVGKPVTVDPIDFEEEPTIRGALDKALEKGAAQLATYRISGKNPGDSYYVNAESNVNIPYDNKVYKLKLIQKSAPDANKFFELQVLTDGDPIILQSDSSVPKSRGNVVSYKVVALYLLEDKVAVFVEYTSPDMMDYENQPYYDKRQLIVTGSLVRKEE